jgi:hypothetical protein
VRIHRSVAAAWRRSLARVRGCFDGQGGDPEFDDEVRAHLLSLAERFERQGMTARDAEEAARRQFGNTTLLRQQRWEMGTLVSVEALWQDLGYALRTLWKSRGFALVSIVTLALGIGASTAIFSVIDNVLLEPFPYKNPGQMVFLQVHDTQRGQEGDRQGYTAAEYLELAEQNHVFLETTAAAKHIQGRSLVH